MLNPVITGAVVTLGHHLLEDGNSVILSDKKLEEVEQLKSGKHNVKGSDSTKEKEKS